jgi:hypothetical protein
MPMIWLSNRYDMAINFHLAAMYGIIYTQYCKWPIVTGCFVLQIRTIYSCHFVSDTLTLCALTGQLTLPSANVG